MSLRPGLPVPPFEERHLYDPDVDPVTQFRGQWRHLSNFAPAVHTIEALTYPTAEHSFNALKTLNPRQRVHVQSAPTPQEAKRRGRNVMLRPDWDNRVRYEVMDAVLRAKFTAHPARIEFLLSTGMALLVEGNGHRDDHWGWRLDTETGDNHLGRALMRLRHALREGH